MGNNNALAAAAASKSSSGSFTFLLLIALVFIGFYFLMIRPQQRRRQQTQQQQNTVTPGARVRTTAGMYATVSAVDGDDVILEVAPGVEVRYMKRAIMEVVSPGEADASDEGETVEDIHDGYAEDDVPEDDEPADTHEDAGSATSSLADSHEDAGPATNGQASSRDGVTGSGNAF
jgi:preprotein translocase subunit YajC